MDLQKHCLFLFKQLAKKYKKLEKKDDSEIVHEMRVLLKQWFALHFLCDKKGMTSLPKERCYSACKRLFKLLGQLRLAGFQHHWLEQWKKEYHMNNCKEIHKTIRSNHKKYFRKLHHQSYRMVLNNYKVYCLHVPFCSDLTDMLQRYQILTSKIKTEIFSAKHHTSEWHALRKTLKTYLYLSDFLCPENQKNNNCYQTLAEALGIWHDSIDEWNFFNTAGLGLSYPVAAESILKCINNNETIVRSELRAFQN